FSCAATSFAMVKTSHGPTKSSSSASSKIRMPSFRVIARLPCRRNLAAECDGETIHRDTGFHARRACDETGYLHMRMRRSFAQIVLRMPPAALGTEFEAVALFFLDGEEEHPVRRQPRRNPGKEFFEIAKIDHRVGGEDEIVAPL